MKNLKRIILLITIVLVNNTNAQFNLGIQLGLNSTSVDQTFPDDVHDGFYPSKSKLGFNAGLVFEYVLNDNMGLQSGLFYTQKGYQVDWDAFLKREDMEGSIDGYWKYTYNYLELPLHFYYNLNGFVINAGPYLAYGLGGTYVVDAKYKVDGESGTISDSALLTAISGDINANNVFDGNEDIPFNKYYKAFDAGFDFGVGYKYKQFMLKAQYSLGLINMTPDIKGLEAFDTNDYKVTNRGLSFSLVYYCKK